MRSASDTILCAFPSYGMSIKLCLKHLLYSKMIITLNQTTASTHVQSNDSFSRDDWQIMKQKERDNYRLSSSLVLEQRTLRSSKKRSPLNFFSVFFHTFKGIPIDLTVARSLSRCSCFSLISRFVFIFSLTQNKKIYKSKLNTAILRLFEDSN